MVSLVPPPTTTKTKKRATPVESTKKKTKAAPPQPKDESTEDKKTSKEDNNEANELSAEDIAFEKLLNSQRDILARLDFGNASNSSELQFVEGPDNLPLVSPHSSASEFHLSYEFEYDYHCQQQQEQFEFEQQQQAFLQSQAGYPTHTHQGYPYHHHQSAAASYAPPRQQQRQRYENCQYAGADAPPSTSCGRGNNFPRDSTHSVGVGDDRFILDQIQIGGRGDAIKGPAVFDDAFDNTNVVQRRRKRETEQELMDTFHSSHHHRRTSNKKRRSGASSHCKSTTPTVYDDLLPVPSDLNDLDHDDDNASTASLLLDDLDFPSMHGNESSPPLTATNTNSKEPADIASTTVDKPVVSMVDGDETNNSTTRRSSRNLWKPRQRRSGNSTSEVTATGLSIQDQRAMWKPRKSSSSSVMMNDSCASIQVDDLAQEKDLKAPAGEQAKDATEVVEV